MAYQQEPKSGGMSCLKLAGVGCAVVLLIALGAGIWVALSWKGWAVDAAMFGIEHGMDMNISEEEQTQIRTRLEGLAEDFKSGELSGEELGRIVEALADGPIFPMAVASAYEKHHILNKADLNQEEKDECVHQLHRLIRALSEESIHANEVEMLMDPVMSTTTVTTDGTTTSSNKTLKKHTTREEVLEATANIKARCDELGVSNDPYPFNFANELDKALDKALGEQGAR
jgi:hypothetical protein